jgi:quinoprotein glucose dehydrogenase
MTEDMVTRRTEAVHKIMLDKLKSLDFGGRFTPPSPKGAIVFPGFSGGAEWGGQAYDPETHIFYINANEMPWVIRLVPPRSVQRTSKASVIYRGRCANCHRADRKGAPPEYPALDDLTSRMSETQLADVIRKGSGRMPAFANMGEPAIKVLVDFLMDKGDKEALVERPRPPVELKYTMDGYNKFLDPDGYPGITPPWGTLSAINLDTGEYVWKKPFGEYPELVAQGMKDTGAESHGGGVVTAGGLFFIAASAHDKKLRAYDKKTGNILWETVLPHGGNATLAMYEVKGKQYVVVPCGGGRGGPTGGSYVAFALP